MAVVPVTGTAGEGALYPAFAPGKRGLTRTAYARVDPLRTIGKRRIRRVFGQVADAALRAFDQGLALFLGLG